jgi:hypothetical protein
VVLLLLLLGAGLLSGLLASCQLPTVGGITDNCPAGYGYLDTQTLQCYQGSGPGVDNSAGGGVRIDNCGAGYPYYNAGQQKCWSSVPGGAKASVSNGNTGGGSDAGRPAPTAAPNCVVSSEASNDGGRGYRRVDTTSSAPCYSHWNVSAANGANCGTYIYSPGNPIGPYRAPNNVWNIVSWENYSDHVTAFLADGKALEFYCVTNLRNEPQTALYGTDWR